MKSIKVSLITVLLLFMALPVFAQKFAYVHSQKVLTEYQEYKDVQNKLAEIQNKYQAEYDQLVQDYTQQLQEIESQSLLLSPEKKAEKEKMMQTKGMEIEKYKYEKLGPQGEYYRKQAELGQPIIDKVANVIKEIGEADGYDYILDGATGSVVYFKPEYDITDQVIEELNKNKVSTTTTSGKK
ncbi:MAG: OmpH family outer membrane protein [Calditrichaeota bacterium]|nr:MAG: OmpH family outer membrane protein [Calditrichota bacterium]MBL1204241.1 OmpH family outer membrane protein [Calditrichota bacterium]NOG44071.1 OmpH family outer membrane protein [Calditrichota bacterium]